MWLMLLKQYWSQLLLSALCLFLLASLMTETLKHKDTTLEKEQYRIALDYQNASLLAQKNEYDEKLSRLPTEIEKITTRYKVIYENIDNWKGDINATDCNNSDTFLRSVIY